MTEFAISTESLAKAYGNILAVCGMNLKVPRDSIYGFLGPNGAGKTTTIKMLSGLVRPTSGFGLCLGIGCFQRTYGHSSTHRVCQ
jgi:ABC-type multidrug transport system ATPase subunit